VFHNIVVFLQKMIFETQPIFSGKSINDQAFFLSQQLREPLGKWLAPVCFCTMCSLSHDSPVSFEPLPVAS
jgi:hypothetical protein